MNVSFNCGDWVQVKTPAEIGETLDENGTLDGLPFMAEMRQFCGRTFRVLRRAEKTCVEFPGIYRIREFRGDDVLILDGLRCSGSDHDGCGRACLLFWKAAWLRSVDGPAKDQHLIPVEALSMAKSRVSPTLYFCQSTELSKATQPLSRTRIVSKCFTEVTSGNRGFFEMLGLMLAPLWRKATAWVPRARLAGSLKRTPVQALDLQPGDWVEIKSAAEIAQTLDTQGRNRGLICDFGMCQYSGGRYQVRNRLDRMISEPTGQMRKVESTVILEGLKCLCWNVFGGCPREDFMYWREIWLKPSPSPRASVNGSANSSEQICTEDVQV